MDKRIDVSRRIVEEEYANRLTVPALARRVALSRSHFELLFKREMRITPHVYLREVRLRHLAELLCQDHGSIKEAILSVGYHSIPDADRHFKRRFGMTPSEMQEGSMQKAVSGIQKAAHGAPRIYATPKQQRVLARAA